MKDKDVSKSMNAFNQNISALKSSLIFVCFLSKDYQTCINNRIEYSIALEENMKIINFYFNKYEYVNRRTNSLNVNLNLISSRGLHLLVKGMKNEIDQNNSYLIVKKQQDEFQDLIKNFKRIYNNAINY